MFLFLIKSQLAYECIVYIGSFEYGFYKVLKTGKLWQLSNEVSDIPRLVCPVKLIKSSIEQNSAKVRELGRSFSV